MLCCAGCVQVLVRSMGQAENKKTMLEQARNDQRRRVDDAKKALDDAQRRFRQAAGSECAGREGRSNVPWTLANVNLRFCDQSLAYHPAMTIAACPPSCAGNPPPVPAALANQLHGAPSVDEGVAQRERDSQAAKDELVRGAGQAPLQEIVEGLYRCALHLAVNARML